MTLAAHGLYRSFRGQPAVENVSLSIESGELYGLVGPDGAGKTTTIRMLAGLLRPDAGTVDIDRDALGYMPQQYSLYGDLTVAENLTFFGRLFGLSGAERKARTDRLLEITRLGRFRGRRAADLSGGMYKKLALSCALLHEPSVLLLDEPSNGVDPVSRRELWDLLYEFVSVGMSVVLSTPYMDEAARCHRVGLLHSGQLLAEGTPDALVGQFRHPTVRYWVEDRDAAEIELAANPAVLAVSPEGAALRLVVHAEHTDLLTDLSAQGRVESVAATFEDVFLGLLQDPEAVSP